MTTRSICLATAAAAMIALAPAVARAQTTVTTTTTTTTEFVPINIVTIDPAPTLPNGEPIDYTVLANPHFDFVDFNQARREGFSHHDIAVMAKISEKADVPFSDVKQLALNGMAYPTIADHYGLTLSDVWHTRDYEDRIAMYDAAYHTTGEFAVRNLVAAYRAEYSNGGTYDVSPNASLSDIVNSSPDLTMFARALRHARIMKILSGPGPYTVFAPTDTAFAKLSSNQINALMNNRDELVKVLDYCIIPQRIDAAEAIAMTSPTSPATLEGDSLQVTNTSGVVYINGATVTKADVLGDNGVIHEVDTVLLPPSVTSIQ
jgi:uncharacterized surface protein with fasciclin (FAS1) repeats